MNQLCDGGGDVNDREETHQLPHMVWAVRSAEWPGGPVELPI